MMFREPFGGIIPGARGAVLAALLRTDAPLTGRQIHSLVSDDHSLWSVQEALKVLTRLGLVNTQVVGRAGVHTIQEDHVSVGPLRELLDPLAALTTVVREEVGENVEAVILFGSIARGEATAASDVDLAVIAPADWEGRSDLQDAVRSRLGNACDVLVFDPKDLPRLVSAREPVIGKILADGVALVGAMPRVQSGAA